MTFIALIHEEDNITAVEGIKLGLLNLGYKVESFSNSIDPYSQFLNKITRKSDVIILLKTTEDPVTPHPFSEKDLLYKSVELLWQLFNEEDYPTHFTVIPVALHYGFGNWPESIRKHSIVGLGTNLSIDKVVSAVSDKIEIFLAKRDAGRKEVQERVESTLGDYVKEAISGLEKREKADRNLGIFLNFFGLGLLVAAILFGLINLRMIESDPEISVPRMVYMSVKNFVILGILFVACKYAFTIGKSYTNEALKSADRVHAIQFGRFYLRAFGDQVTGAEVREVFQHWNINSPSSFVSLDTTSFDPKIEEKVTEIIKTAIASAKDLKA